MFLASSIFLLLYLACPVLSGSVVGVNVAYDAPASPQVALAYGTFQGFSGNSTDSFLGIPFAQPPTGDLRLRLPQPPQKISGVYNASSFGNACPQQAIFDPNAVLPTIPGLSVSEIGESIAVTGAVASEDCLYLNVIRPLGVPSSAKLPVLVWIFGGGYMVGAASAYDGGPVVERSIALGEPVIYVSVNYRLNAFGFLAGKEVKEAGLGNIGLHDQRFALQWVQKYIEHFGGDSSKVIIWGESAGSTSVIAQMTTASGYNDGLFRGAVMESGFPAPMNDITEGQSIYDQLVAATNCSSTSNSSSTLDCLRAAPYETLMQAVNNTPSFESYTSLNLTWAPRVDGVFFDRTLRQSFEDGSFTKIPVIAGDCDDEGTFFSLFFSNITTNEDFLSYVPNLLPGASTSQAASIGQVYPEDPSQGSPFGTGTNWTITPEYKRMAALIGDVAFQAPRRFMLEKISQSQATWGFLYRRSKSTPYVGSYHSSDLTEFYAESENPDYIATDALINFAYRLNPNAASANASVPSGLDNINWPQWSNATGSPSLLTFEDPANLTITYDNFRVQAMEVVNELQAQLSL